MRQIETQARRFNSYRGWKTIGDKKNFFKSAWETKYAIHLQKLKEKKEIADWQYEPQTFWFEKIKRGVRSYKPDFLISLPSGEQYWVEVKGYMDQRSKTKLARFKRYFPKETLVIVDKKWFDEMKKQKSKEYVD